MCFSSYVHLVTVSNMSIIIHIGYIIAHGNEIVNRSDDRMMGEQESRFHVRIVVTVNNK